MKNGGSRHILGARLPLFCMFRRMCCEREKKNAAYSRCFVCGIGLLAFVCLCGFDDENYYFSDPLSAESTVIFPIKTAEEIFKSMGTQAVAILKTAE